VNERGIDMSVVLDNKTRAEMNQLRLKLSQAGVELGGHIKEIIAVYWNPVGFDFLADDSRQLHRLAQKAEQNKKLINDVVTMPGYDPWSKAGIVSDGFSRVGAAPRVHLDIAIGQPGSQDYPGLCRVYTDQRQRNPNPNPGVTRPVTPLAVAMNSEVFRNIQGRLRDFNVPIMIKDHVEDDPAVLRRLAGRNIDPLTARRTVLEGIDFIVKDRAKFETALQSARKGTDQGLVRGSKFEWKEHWALATSFKATDGIGYREPWRLTLKERPLVAGQMTAPRLVLKGRSFRSLSRGTAVTGHPDTPELDGPFSANFGASINLDFSALHVAVAEIDYGTNPRTTCNIHVDETGIVLESLDGVSITPGVISHLLNELLFKTNAAGHIPRWFIDHFDFFVFGPGQSHAKAGVNFDIAKGSRYRWKITGSWGVTSYGRFEWTGTTSFDLKHDVGSGG
jgi:hypothetical protein